VVAELEEVGTTHDSIVIKVEANIRAADTIAEV
jgi:hypothetical protein